MCVLNNLCFSKVYKQSLCYSTLYYNILSSVCCMCTVMQYTILCPTTQYYMMIILLYTHFKLHNTMYHTALYMAVWLLNFIAFKINWLKCKLNTWSYYTILFCYLYIYKYITEVTLMSSSPEIFALRNHPTPHHRQADRDRDEDWRCRAVQQRQRGWSVGQGFRGTPSCPYELGTSAWRK